MSWEKVRLSEICEINIGKTPSRNISSYWGGNNKWISISDLKGKRYVEDTKENISEKAVKESGIKAIPPNTLLYSFKLSIGKIAITKDYIYSNEAIASLPILDKTKVSLDYLYWAMQTLQLDSVGDKAVMGVTLNKAKLKNLEIPLPPLSIQEKIATILDKADALRRKDQELLKKYDELAQAIFIDMFGDPVKNEKGWEVKRLEELGYLKNGLNYGNNESGKELKVFGVGDFKSNWLFDDYTNLKTLNLDTIVNRSFLLAEGDILFVRSNGNKDLIGRAALLKNINTEITYSGFCIKFTRTSSAVNEYYLIRLLVNSKFKKYILNGGRGANIQNINQKILSALNIPVPPLHLQEAFAEKIKLINQIKAKTNAEKSEELFQTLLQKAFKGELVS